MKKKKLYWIKCEKYQKFKNSEILYIFNKIIVLFAICDKCGSSNDKILQEEETIEIFKFKFI